MTILTHSHGALHSQGIFYHTRTSSLVRKVIKGVLSEESTGPHQVWTTYTLTG